MFDGCEALQDGEKPDNQMQTGFITATLSGVIGEKYTELYGEGRIAAAETAP